jgi:hypothetical protein
MESIENPGTASDDQARSNTKRIQTISLTLLAIAIVQLICIIVGFRNAAPSVFLLIGGMMTACFALLTELHATVLKWPPLRPRPVLAFYAYILLIISISFIGAVIGFVTNPPPHAVTYVAGALQVVSNGFVAAWFGAVVRRARSLA